MFFFIDYSDILTLTRHTVLCVGARHHQADGLDPVPPVGLLHTVAATAAPHAHVD